MIYLSGYRPMPTNLSYQQRVKETNIKQIFDYLRSGLCESRADLVRAMDLSATSVSVLVEELQLREFIAETGPKPTAQPGRRPIGLQFNADARHIAIFYISMRGISFTLLNLTCEVLEHIFLDYDSSQCKSKDAGECYAEKFVDILKNNSRCFDPARTLCVGICIPGVYLPSAHKFTMNSAIQVEFSEASMEAFERRIGIPVFVENASVCLAYAEKKYLDAVKPDDGSTKDLLYINISDGVGASLISRGDIFTGPYHTAGEIGHMTIDYHGRPCACGNRGCLERYVNLNAILDSARALCAEAGRSQPDSFAQLAAECQDYPEVDGLLQEVAEQLSYGIYNMICATGIQNIALGGGIEALGNRFLQYLRGYIGGKTFALHDHLTINYASAGANAESIGFAHYYLDKAYTITY